MTLSEQMKEKADAYIQHIEDTYDPDMSIVIPRILKDIEIEANQGYYQKQVPLSIIIYDQGIRDKFKYKIFSDKLIEELKKLGFIVENKDYLTVSWK